MLYSNFTTPPHSKGTRKFQTLAPQTVNGHGILGVLNITAHEYKKIMSELSE